jgi:hypothetical protein
MVGLGEGADGRPSNGKLAAARRFGNLGLRLTLETAILTTYWQLSQAANTSSTAASTSARTAPFDA